MFGYQICYKFV